MRVFTRRATMCKACTHCPPGRIDCRGLPYPLARDGAAIADVLSIQCNYYGTQGPSGVDRGRCGSILVDAGSTRQPRDLRMDLRRPLLATPTVRVYAFGSPFQSYIASIGIPLWTLERRHCAQIAHKQKDNRQRKRIRLSVIIVAACAAHPYPWP